MLQRGLKPNILTFSNLIRCAALCGLSHKGVDLFEMMPAFGCEPDYHVFSSMIFVYADMGNVYMALKLYDIVKNEKWLIGAVAFSALIKMYQLLGNYDGCLSVYNDMKVLGVKPNKIVYNTLVAAMGKDKRARNAKEVYQEMREKGLTLNKFLYSMLLDACADVGFVHSYGKAKRTDDVVNMFNQFWDIGITPNDRLCDCLLYVMTQIPKEELGKITNCIEKANPKLGNILTYLMEEKEDDGYFMKEVSEFLSAAHEQVKMYLCNNLIDICYNLGVEDKGRDLLGLGLWLEIYSDIQSRSKSQRCLDLDQFSVGAVITALHVWLDELSKAFELDEELPHVLGICWRRKPSNEDLACVFESYLMELNSPFYKDTDTNCWFYTTIQEAMSWLQSGGSDETIAEYN
ncbi:pentatricopeptide repeat-containing protein, chloroplastic [Trifolium repens]|nr:pentatricopeptide repeat-containing protein, chloroplastic [Trifolium repens]